MGTPKKPSLTYISRDRGAEVACDPELLTRAWQHRVSNQLLKAKDFKLNISVWKIAQPGGAISYNCRENDSTKAMLQKAVDLRIDQGMTPKAAKESADEYRTYANIHSEVNVVAEIYRLPGEVVQVFTERKPCPACQSFITQNFPKVIHKPFFYYLLPPGSERTWQLSFYGNNLKLYMLDRYQA